MNRRKIERAIGYVMLAILAPGAYVGLGLLFDWRFARAFVGGMTIIVLVALWICAAVYLIDD